MKEFKNIEERKNIMNHQNAIYTSYGVLSIVNSTNFLEAVEALKNGECKCIYGTRGGILSLNDDGCLVYDSKKNARGSEGNIYFAPEDYLLPWRWLN